VVYKPKDTYFEEKNFYFISMHLSYSCANCQSEKITKQLGWIRPFVSHRMFDLSLEKDMVGGKEIFPFLYTNSIYCIECGFIFSQIRPDDVEMKRYYSGYFLGDYVVTRTKFEPGFAEIAEKFISNEKYVRDRIPQIDDFTSMVALATKITKVLDYGGNRGDYFPEWSRRAWIKRYVYDISDNEDLNDEVNYLQSLKGFKFEFVMCMNVLEHVPYPGKIICEISATQRSGDHLFIAVPCEVELDASPSRYPKVFHEHINFFRERSLNSLIKRNGYTVINFKIFNIDVGWTTEKTLWMLARKL